MFKAKNSVNMVYKCTVQLLEDADVLECEFQVSCRFFIYFLPNPPARVCTSSSDPLDSLQPNHKGKFLLEQICDQMDISDRDRDYFGLRFVDNTKQRVRNNAFIYLTALWIA